MSQQRVVDLIVLRRDRSDLAEAVRQGIASQGGVALQVHQVVGLPRPEDPNRWATIARARDTGKRLGGSPWVMYLDDDVVLGPECIARLVEALRQRPGFAALAADYLGESGPTNGDVHSSRHVAMGATLFRRQTLAFLTFRWEPGRCECQCCCDDLRRAGFGIGYLRGAEARHEPGLTAPALDETEAPDGARHPAIGADPPPRLPGRILAAFDRGHLGRFRRLFLGSLRAWGNRQTVTALAYGLTPSEARALAMQPGLEVICRQSNGVSVPIRRLLDFQEVIARWPEATPVAYWDAGDVLFQGDLGPLWDLVHAHPDRLLAVREPLGHPENLAVRIWLRTIYDPEARQRALTLIAEHGFLNSGFAAGTARTMLAYFREAHRLRHSPALDGTSDWGDQTALNLYCHNQPSRWHEVPDSWNYCLYQRPNRQYRIRPDGRIVSATGAPIHVVHGNGKSLRQIELSFSETPR